jgi:hypothetical protein
LIVRVGIDESGRLVYSPVYHLMRSIYSHKETVAYVLITLGALDDDRGPDHVHCQLLRLYMRFASSRRSEDGAEIQCILFMQEKMF